MSLIPDLKSAKQPTAVYDVVLADFAKVTEVATGTTAVLKVGDAVMLGGPNWIPYVSGAYGGASDIAIVIGDPLTDGSEFAMPTHFELLKAGGVDLDAVGLGTDTEAERLALRGHLREKGIFSRRSQKTVG